MLSLSQCVCVCVCVYVCVSVCRSKSGKERDQTGTRGAYLFYSVCCPFSFFFPLPSFPPCLLSPFFFFWGGGCFAQIRSAFSIEVDKYGCEKLIDPSDYPKDPRYRDPPFPSSLASWPILCVSACLRVCVSVYLSVCVPVPVCLGLSLSVYARVHAPTALLALLWHLPRSLTFDQVAERIQPPKGVLTDVKDR